jgi:two-component system, CitB family, response regulator MalR
MIRVLIVEDDPMVAELNKRYLDKTDGFALAAMIRSADETLNFLEREEVDLILLDVYMPGTNGLGLLTHIRKSGRKLDVILVTAASDCESIEKALRYGVVDYLIKPFEFERFNSALIAYRDRVSFMKQQNILSQDQLDKKILNRDQVHLTVGLPKGLDRKTLEVIEARIRDSKGNTFTTEEMAGKVGISRVSMRKYLEFLNQSGILEVRISYGSIGRPVYQYHCMDYEGRMSKC